MSAEPTSAKRWNDNENNIFLKFNGWALPRTCSSGLQSWTVWVTARTSRPTHQKRLPATTDWFQSESICGNHNILLKAYFFHFVLPLPTFVTASSSSHLKKFTMICTLRFYFVDCWASIPAILLFLVSVILLENSSRIISFSCHCLVFCSFDDGFFFFFPLCTQIM